MCVVLLSIHPEHVENIFAGIKRYEYRKVRCRSRVNKIIIYSTAPVMAVVGEAEVLNVIEDEPDKVWEITSKYSGISKNYFDKYYRRKNTAIAYELGKVKKYPEPLKLGDFGINFAPQSFVYIK